MTDGAAGRIVLQALQNRGWATAKEAWVRASKVRPGLGLATVYRALKTGIAEGTVVAAVIDGTRRYTASGSVAVVAMDLPVRDAELERELQNTILKRFPSARSIQLFVR